MSVKRQLLRTSKPQSKKKGRAAVPAPIYNKDATGGNVFAFPAEIKLPNYENGGHSVKKVPGMSLLDYFAARIYAGQPWPWSWLPARIRARQAYGHAAALLQIRGQFIK